MDTNTKATDTGKDYQIEMLKDELKKQRRRQRIWSVVIFAVFFFVLAIIIFVSLIYIDSDYIRNLQHENASVQRNVDYLQFVVPVLLAMGAFMAAALGMNRLKHLDDQVEKIEQRLAEKFDQYKDNVNESIKNTVTSEIQDKSKGYIDSLADTASKNEEKIDKLISDAKSGIESYAKDVRKAIEADKKTSSEVILAELDKIAQETADAKERIDKFNQEYGWLKNEEDHINQDDLLVQSVSDAHRLVESMYMSNAITASAKAKQVNVIVQKVLREEISGDTADYHNLAAELARHELKNLAVSVCARGLEFFPENEDLLADIILYTSQIGERAAGVSVERYINDLLNIDRKSWSWRCFEFLADYYISVKRYNDAKEICDDYIRYLPTDERGYAEYAEVYGYLYFGSEAEEKQIKVLKEAVDKGIACPRCANQLSEIYADRGDLENAIKYSSIAILSLAQQQPSVNYAYIFLKRALYEDRLLHKKQIESDNSSEVDERLAKRALADYDRAIKSGKLTPITTNQARTRYNLIASYIGEKEYPSDGPSTGDLLSILAQLKDNDDSE